MTNNSHKKQPFYSIILFVIVISIFLTGCGGGFGTDSDNSKDLQETIFGSDSL